MGDFAAHLWQSLREVGRLENTVLFTYDLHTCQGIMARGIPCFLDRWSTQPSQLPGLSSASSTFPWKRLSLMVQNCRAPFIRAHRFHSWLCSWVFEHMVYDVCDYTAGQYGKEVPHWYSKYSWALKFLEWGYTAVFVELDMVFLKDPLPFFNKEVYDFQGLSDWRVAEVPDPKVCLAHIAIVPCNMRTCNLSAATTNGLNPKSLSIVA